MKSLKENSPEYRASPHFVAASRWHKKRDQNEINSANKETGCILKLLTCVTFFNLYTTSIKQDITQGRSDSAGQMAGKKIKPVYKWYTLGPDEDKIPCPGSESLAELCCTGSYFKVVFPAVEVVLFCFWSWLSGRHFNVATRLLSWTYLLAVCVLWIYELKLN